MTLSTAGKAVGGADCGGDVEVHLVSPVLSHCVRHRKVGLAPPDLVKQRYMKRVPLCYTPALNSITKADVSW